VAISTDGCNDKPTQFSGAEVGSGNYKNGICTLSCAPLTSACWYTAADLYSERKCESTLMQLWKCLLFHDFDRLAGDESDYNEDKRSEVATHMQNNVGLVAE